MKKNKETWVKMKISHKINNNSKFDIEGREIKREVSEFNYSIKHWSYAFSVNSRFEVPLTQNNELQYILRQFL